LPGLNYSIAANYYVSGFNQVNGAAGNDTFILPNGASFTGALNGNAGANTLDYSNWTTAVSVDIPANTATNVATISNVGGFKGGSALDSLAGPAGASTWNITSSNSGNITGGYSFQSFEHVTCGGANDVFVFSNGAGITGSLAGSGGTDKLDCAAYTTAVTVNLQGGSSTCAPTFSGFEQFAGGGGSDTLVSDGSATFWSITGANSGTIPGYSFSSFENLTGSALSESFVFSDGASLAGTVGAGVGTDVLDFSAYTTPVTVNLQSGTGSRVGSFSGIEQFMGGGGSDTIAGQDVATTWNITSNNNGNVPGYSFQSFENLTGGSSDDGFVFPNGVSVGGVVNGGAGSNTLDFSAYTTALTVDMTGGPVRTREAFRTFRTRRRVPAMTRSRAAQATITL